MRLALSSKPDNELASTKVTGQIGCVPADPRPDRSVRPRRTPIGAGSRPALLVVVGLAAFVSIATATSCDTVAAANGATGNQEFVQEIATRLKTAYSMAYTAEYALAGGGTGTIAQLPATGQAAYTSRQPQPNDKTSPRGAWVQVPTGGESPRAFPSGLADPVELRSRR